MRPGRRSGDAPIESVSTTSPLYRGYLIALATLPCLLLFVDFRTAQKLYALIGGINKYQQLAAFEAHELLSEGRLDLLEACAPGISTGTGSRQTAVNQHHRDARQGCRGLGGP